DRDTPLGELGMDSLMAVELSTRLQQQVGGTYPIPPTLVFDYPSVAAMTDHLWELMEDTAVSEETPSTVVVRGPSRDDAVAIIGLGCRFPGADGPEEFWRILQEGIDATSDVPNDRWDL